MTVHAAVGHVCYECFTGAHDACEGCSCESPRHHRSIIASVVVDVLPQYRVVTGKLRGLIVGEDDTCECDAQLGGCDGTGFVEAREFAGSDPCRHCGGVGRVLGYPDFGPPTRVERLEAPSEESRRSA